MLYRFGPFLADREAYRVTAADRALDLTPKLLDLLFYLLDRPATLVTKEELLDNVWPGANVTDNALAQAVSELRESIGDAASAPTYIRTVARRGYRFVAPIDVASEPAGRASRPATAPPQGNATAAPGKPEAVGSDPRVSIAVPDFANVTGNADVAWLAAGIAETVTSDLTALSHFRVVDRWRVVQASRVPGATTHDIGMALGVSRLVLGSYQHSGAQLRITARVIDVATGQSVADAKVDGLLDDVFSLQDTIVTTFARDLGVPGVAAGARVGVRETSSLEAYRAHTEGWLKIETLDTDLVSASILDFERAIAADSAYAIAYTGLANAEFVAFEMTRMSREPNTAALRAGIEHARRAIQLDEDLAEAHATLSFLLVSALRHDEARAAAQRAVALEPESWRHHYRLGHASWGSARVRALERASSLYPQFPYAHFELAMVHVARGRLDLAEQVARKGIGGQDRQGASGTRFPAIGFHWLLGSIEALAGGFVQAADQFEGELAQVDRRRLYGPEYAALALVSRGHAELARDDAAAALASFRSSLTSVPGHARALVGTAAAYERLGDRPRAAAAWQEAAAGQLQLERTGREHEATLTRACAAALQGDDAAAVEAVRRYLGQVPVSHLGWTIPIEPAFRHLHGRQDFAEVLALLAERA